MKKGILGGTFNPIHIAHIEIGRAAKEQFSLDRLYFMPLSVPSYKDTKDIESFSDRINMAKIAADSLLGGEKNGYFVSDLEGKREGYTYTADTITILKEKEPDTDFYFIIGGDSLMSFTKWKKPEVITHNATLLVSPRPDTDLSELEREAERLRHNLAANIYFIKNIDLNVSSTEIRKQLNNRLSVNTVPSPVLDYIKERGLYVRK